MAKVIMPLLSQMVRNKIGDIVFYRRGDWGINVARIRVKPRNPRTHAQQANRNNIGTLLKIYLGRLSPAGAVLYKYNMATKTWVPITIASTETFTTDDMDAWKAYKTLSRQGHIVSGKYAFLSENVKRLKAGLNPYKRPGVEFAITE
jgi:hypothetical protein